MSANEPAKRKKAATPSAPPGLSRHDAEQAVRQLLAECATDRRNRATSLRLNLTLWTAANIAVDQGWAPSLTALVEDGLTDRLAELAADFDEQAALDEHYAKYPEAKAELWELAVAAALLDGNPLAEHPDLLRRAADAVGDRTDLDGILLWAEGAHAASTVA